MNLSNVYQEQKDYKNSNKYHRKYTKIKDSVFSQDKVKALGRLEAERDQIVKERKETEAARLKKEKASQRNTMQYLAIGSLVVIMAVFLLLSGRMRIKEWKARALVFLTFIFMFEFILVMIDPWADEYSEGIPFIKFAINLALALIIFPAHQYFEKKVSQKVVKQGEL